MIQKIEETSKNDVINLSLDTIQIGKQALVFVNSKRSAEKCAEDVARKRPKDDSLNELRESALKALPKPTKQCERLANCIEKGIAFHHAGLHHLQKELIEDNFRTGKIKIICCTTTMAAGVDLPAFRSIIRDVKRFSQRGMDYIPTIEYHQAAGRAGRPGMEDFGEAIIICKDQEAKEEAIERYVHGEPEKIFSKLAVEPVFRTYLLSLIVSKITSSKEKVLEFFSKTFWAHHYQDMDELERIINKVLEMLKKWGFVEDKKSEFISACDINEEKLIATDLGKRISQLYIDPLTAYHLIKGLKNADKFVEDFQLLNLISNTLEMRPLLRVKVSEAENYEDFIAKHEDEFLMEIPNYFEHEYSAFLNSIKTTRMFMDWIDEEDENFLLEKYNIRPGETRYKIEKADWLLYGLKEISMILDIKWIIKELEKLRIRLKYGVKEELVPLLKLKGIGRVRSRSLFSKGIKTISELKKVDLHRLKDIVGDKTAVNLKKQVGQNEESKNQRL